MEALQTFAIRRWRIVLAVGGLHVLMLFAVLEARHGTNFGLRDTSHSMHWLSAINAPDPAKPPARWSPAATPVPDATIALGRPLESADPGKAPIARREQSAELPRETTIVDADPLAGAAAGAAIPEPGGAVLDTAAFQILQSQLVEASASYSGADRIGWPRVAIAVGIDGSPRAATVETSSGDAEFDRLVVDRVLAFGRLLRPETGRDRVVPKYYLLPSFDIAGVDRST
jgi:hypothetical protein